MSEIVARHMLQLENPRVAVMNIGAEEGKGSERVRQAAEALEKTPGLNYIGFVEGRDFFEGVADGGLLGR
jgi:glycerol-3-phosphate acyltransferase PlsX